ncbi:PREDICTED: uncharacterized protein LOC108781880 [Cyphomyrmex costatus]|uniref:uncharacterized protein LOC108781880 n=1 Tax=Cyphomyrmex costatus TaxID=456900 RepID=UPI0008522668|nr:PREDICTED: uncharacterized protein LOC108781880 [Cyphomyrmex costatus]
MQKLMVGLLLCNENQAASHDGGVLFKILNLLQEGGAERSNYFSDFVTHLIAGNEALENNISAAKDLYEIPAVEFNPICPHSRFFACKELKMAPSGKRSMIINADPALNHKSSVQWIIFNDS